jgi:cell division protein ZapA (FtsZ GTPase activity inhibitor)
MTVATTIDLQKRLIDSMDRQDVAALEQATIDLSRHLASMSNKGPVAGDHALLDALNCALRQNDALKARVRFLADRNRQKIDRRNALRVGGSALYSKSA